VKKMADNDSGTANDGSRIAAQGTVEPQPTNTPLQPGLKFDEKGKATITLKDGTDEEYRLVDFQANFSGVKNLKIDGEEYPYAVFSGGAPVEKDGVRYKVEYIVDAKAIYRGDKDPVVYSVISGRKGVSIAGAVGVVEGKIPEEVEQAVQQAMQKTEPETTIRKERLEKILQNSENRPKTVMGNMVAIFEGDEESVWGQVVEGSNVVSVIKNDGYESPEEATEYGQQLMRELKEIGLKNGEDFSIKIHHGRATPVVKIEFHGEKAAEMAKIYGMDINPEELKQFVGTKKIDEQNSEGKSSGKRADEGENATPAETGLPKSGKHKRGWIGDYNKRQRGAYGVPIEEEDKQLREDAGVKKARRSGGSSYLDDIDNDRIAGGAARRSQMARASSSVGGSWLDRAADKVPYGDSKQWKRNITKGFIATAAVATVFGGLKLSAAVMGGWATAGVVLVAVVGKALHAVDSLYKKSGLLEVTPGINSVNKEVDDYEASRSGQGEVSRA
jgi:hypothetical protein